MSTLEKVQSTRKVVITEDDGHLIPQVETLAEMTEHLGMGWVPDHPDFRDYNLEHEEIKALFQGTKLSKEKLSAPTTPSSVDLRHWCSPIENQGALGSC